LPSGVRWHHKGALHGIAMGITLNLYTGKINFKNVGKDPDRR
jgi:hypothetical protein